MATKEEFNKTDPVPRILDKLLEWTGRDKVGHGFIICYIDENGDPQMKSMASSKIVELGLRNYLSARIRDFDEIESNSVIYGQIDQENEGDE